MTIGIPQGLIYWKKPYFWEVFFEELGFKTIVSPPTNREIAESGVSVSDPETCFANKIFWGHVRWLDDKCDCIFIPRLKANEEKFEYCPKLFGIPDVAKIIARTTILTETFDGRKEKFEKTLRRLGKKLKKKDKEVKEAFRKASLREKELRGEEGFLNKIQPSGKPKIVLISHPYNLYDDYVNLGTKGKLEKLGAEVIFIDEVPASNRELTDDWPKFHWEFGKEMAEKSDKVLDYGIAGAVQISSFQCGCDAVLKEFIERNFKKNKIPFLYLVIDEHTGEAGLQTRLEAFVDTL
jgi:predicted nucleotide-binding protein (sugar kinase/HSP70/actin superfamily)